MDEYNDLIESNSSYRKLLNISFLNKSWFNETLHNYSLYNQDDQYYDDASLIFLVILWTYITPIVFIIFIIVGLLGNSCVVYVILSKQTMRTPTNFMLLNLAISDIIFLSVCVPYTAYKYSSTVWPFGEIACKLVKYCMYVCIFVTVYTLVAVAFQRFLMIVYSKVHTNWRRPNSVFGYIAIIWIVVLVSNIWTWQIHTVKYIDDISYCGVVDEAIGPLFLFFFIAGYAIPLFLISLFYLLIVLFLCRRTKGLSNKMSTGEQGNNNSTTQSLTNNNHDRGANRRHKKRKRVWRVLLIVIVTFALSWLPLHVNSLIAHYSTIPQTTFYQVLRVVWNCMAYGNSCANPIIYNYASREFRKHFAAMFCRKQTRLHTSTSGATAAASTRIGSEAINHPPFSNATEMSRMRTALETHL